MDLTDETQFEMVTSRAEQLAAVSDLDALEQRMASEQASHPLTEHLAVKLARSRRVVPVSCHLSVVFAVYREHQRILTRAEHPHGENFLRRKMAELDWLLPGRWDLTIVDDGCPAGSGRLARQIVESARAQDRVRVLSLDEAIRQGHPAARSLSSAADSQKGGAVHYGLWTAAQQSLHDHVVLFTDADLSTHLGQAGLLLDPILNGGMDAAIGSRREPTSVVVKQGLRNVRGKLFIYLWKRLLPQLQDVVDTQCGFKAFRAEVLPAILQNTIEKRFAFDVELLLRTELRRPGSIFRVPVAWIDSEAASTTTEARPYLPMLKAIVQMYRTYVPSTPAAESFAVFIEELNEAGWQRLLTAIPASIAERQPAEFGTFCEVSAVELLRLANT